MPLTPWGVNSSDSCQTADDVGKQAASVKPLSVALPFSSTGRWMPAFLKLCKVPAVERVNLNYQCGEWMSAHSSLEKLGEFDGSISIPLKFWRQKLILLNTLSPFTKCSPNVHQKVKLKKDIWTTQMFQHLKTHCDITQFIFCFL